MARIGPALDVIAAATTPDERARPRGGGARTAGWLEEQPRDGTASLPTGALIILNTRNRNSGLPTR